MLNMQESKEKLRLQRNEFANNISSAFLNLSSDKDFTDVTLVCEDGQQVEAHKLVLISSSPFFREASLQIPTRLIGWFNSILLTQNSIQTNIQFQINSGDSIQKKIQFNSQGINDTCRIRKVPKKCQK